MVRNHSPGVLVKTLQEQGLSLESKESGQLSSLMGGAEPGGGACPPRGSSGMGSWGRCQALGAPRSACRFPRLTQAAHCGHFIQFSPPCLFYSE